MSRMIHRHVRRYMAEMEELAGMMSPGASNLANLGLIDMDVAPGGT